MLPRARNMKIQKYLVDSTNDDHPITTGIVALTLECALLGKAESNMKLCEASAQKIFFSCILI